MAALTVWSPDTVKDVAESLGITNLNDDVAKALAMDVEYRIHEVVQEALKFMRHAKRTTMTTQDINHALRVLNVEPLYGYSSSRPLKFKEAAYGSGQLYYLDDEEVEFEKVMNMPLPKVPRDVSLKAHWLAIEGVQPAIPQNPTPSDSGKPLTGPPTNGASRNQALPTDTTTKPLVKHVISRELSLYFERATEALTNPTDPAARSAAISSLQNDPGLHQLIPYFTSFIAEKITHGLKDLLTLEMMLHTAHALLRNPNLYIDPYITNLMPSILTCLVGNKLGPTSVEEAAATGREQCAVRDLAASIIHYIINRFADAYHSMKSRIAKTLLRVFMDPQKTLGAQYGAIAGLSGMGTNVLRLLLLPNFKIYELVLRRAMDEGKTNEVEKCLDALMVAIRTLDNDEISAEVVNVGELDEEKVRTVLSKKLGDMVTERIMREKNERVIKFLYSWLPEKEEEKKGKA
ncbi:transcription initiation factor TFIID subunit 6 [Saitoella complicata NRRL Y-17804]|uniref:transcription initiation factor TFIID subunit 6 n=1 Tax=Saitoella complicata (strain BCRC 22490 / CBS 7301 / JCM 7358 / NBRC 10748 / NRRL Y-17804) TaxID=698492 RepID=UPI0008672668|nr:transcription initiation factor TFIID subunit 6 [Saitoella complicata NRRL Y-17804]ODQ54094.1 transcription initiation factor TFIID subunit 6 [Saitoella complicata NRRL Y-17804]